MKNIRITYIKFLLFDVHIFQNHLSNIQINDGLKSLEAFNCLVRRGLSGYLIRDLAIRTRDGSVLEGRVVAWEKHSGDSLGGVQKEQPAEGKRV